MQLQRCQKHFTPHENKKGAGLTWPYWGSWKPIWSDENLSLQGPITDLHSTKLRSLFSCHVHWVEDHSASSIKWLCPFKGLKRTKLSLLRCKTHNQNRNEAKGEGRAGCSENQRQRGSNVKYICWIHLVQTDQMWICARVRFSFRKQSSRKKIRDQSRKIQRKFTLKVLASWFFF